MKKRRAIFFIIIFLSEVLRAQVAINTNGGQPDNSAMLDVNSDSLGILFPRMTSFQREAINSPVPGLIVFDTDDSTFYFYGNNGWKKIGSYYSLWHEQGNYVYTNDSAGIKTASPSAPLEVHGLISEKQTGRSVYLGEGAGYHSNPSTSKDNTAIGYKAMYNNSSGKMNVAAGDSALYSNSSGSYNVAVGSNALKNNNAGFNTAVGYKALYKNTTGTHNTAFGAFAIYSNTSGNNNTAIGDSALFAANASYNTALGASSLRYNTSGIYNVALGYRTLWNNTTGDYNTAMGYKTLKKNTSGNENSVMGDYSLVSNTTGSNNTALGNSVLITMVVGNNNTCLGSGIAHYLINGSGNVFVGTEAGYNEYGSNKLYITPSFNNDPLIGGDFSKNEVYLNGRVGIFTSAPNEFLEVAASNTSGSHSGRMIVSDGKGSQRRALLFVSPNHDDSDTNARIEAFNYGSWTGCNLEFNRVGHGRTYIRSDMNVRGLVKVSTSSAADNSPQEGMIRWDDTRKVFEGYDGNQWKILNGNYNGWGVLPDMQEDTAFIGSDISTGDYFGQSVSISSQYVFAGAPLKDVGSHTQQGKVYVFHDGGLSWSQQDILTASGGAANDHFGVSVSVFEDNTANTGYTYAIIGADGVNSNEGKAYIFKPNASGWYQVVALTPPDGSGGDHFGYSVCAADQYAIVGAYGKNSNRGKAYVYYTNDKGNSWTLAGQLTASDGAANDNFGSSVSIYAYYSYTENAQVYDVLVGAGKKVINGNYQQGAAYIFHGGQYSSNEVNILHASDGTANDRFGNSVSISGDYAFIGAENKETGGNYHQGKVYVFKNNGSSWSEYKSLINPDGAAYDNFGHAVCVNDFYTDYYVIVGAHYKSFDGYSHTGKAYIYHLADTTWKLKAKITSSDLEVSQTGYSVSIYSDQAVTGCNDAKGKVCFIERK